ncbi:MULTISPECIES: hypothetical protein [Nocardia]|nr:MULTISPECIES: hypothetical protein [Nocardia]
MDDPGAFGELVTTVIDPVSPFGAGESVEGSFPTAVTSGAIA